MKTTPLNARKQALKDIKACEPRNLNPYNSLIKRSNAILIQKDINFGYTNLQST